MKILASLLLLLTACDHAVPPPIAQGKCLANQYVGATAITQTCVFKGYTWNCLDDGVKAKCERGAEASGELVKSP